MDQICDACDQLVPDGEQLDYYEADTNWHGARCPHCNKCDDFSDLGEQWAVDQLAEFVKWFRKHETRIALGTSNADTFAARLEIIKDMIEAEIE